MKKVIKWLIILSLTGANLVALFFHLAVGYERSLSCQVENTSSISVDSMLLKVNEYRESSGLKPLKPDQSLCVVAKKRVEEVLTDWSHDQFYEIKFVYGFSYLGENLARGFSTDDQVIEAWKNSPEHNANLLDEQYNYACVAKKLDSKNIEHTVIIFGASK